MWFSKLRLRDRRPRLATEPPATHGASGPTAVVPPAPWRGWRPRLALDPPAPSAAKTEAPASRVLPLDGAADPPERHWTKKRHSAKAASQQSVIAGNDALVQWRFGAMTPWFNDALAQWRQAESPAPPWSKRPNGGGAAVFASEGAGGSNASRGRQPRQGAGGTAAVGPLSPWVAGGSVARRGRQSRNLNFENHMLQSLYRVLSMQFWNLGFIF